jgi:anti-anti-sigma factor
MRSPNDDSSLARIEHSYDEDVCVIAVSGELDMSNIADLRELAYGLRNDALGLVVDLGRTRFIDSTTVGLLFDLHANLARRRQVLRVICAPESNPARLLKVTAFPHGALEERDVPAAVAAIRRELAPAE